MLRIGASVHADRAADGKGLLWDGVETRADDLSWDAGDVNPVDGDAARTGELEHAKESGDERALAAAAAAADPYLLSG